MKDRFTFRAWNIAQKRYMEDLRLIGFGELNTFREVEEAELDKYGQPRHYTVYEEDEVVLEQCTGLKDKNGKLIYENDYIENDNTKDDIYLVVFDEKTARFMAKEMNGNLRLINKNVRVVGNIHEQESK